MHLTQWTGIVGGCVAAIMPAAMAAPSKSPCKKLDSYGGIPMPADFKVLQDTYHKNLLASLGAQGCTKDNISKRRSW